MDGGGVEATELLMLVSSERKLLNLYRINLDFKWQWSLMTTEFNSLRQENRLDHRQNCYTFKKNQ